MDLVNDPFFKDYLDGLESNDDPEMGDDILDYSKEFFDNYEKVKNEINETSNLINDKEVRLSGLPTVRLNFERCLKSNDLEGLSQTQINEWINLVKN